MEKGLFVKDFAQVLRPVEGLFVVASAQKATANNGKLYWNVRLQDSTGQVDAKIWDPLSQEVGELVGNMVVSVRGRMEEFRGKWQLRVDALHMLDDEERAMLDMAWFVAASPFPVDDMEAELKAICQREFTYGPWRDFVDDLLCDGEIAMALRIFPAAQKMHHAYAGGLLEHTLGVCRLCLAMCDCYPQLDRQTLLAGALCHDLGKIREFSVGLSTDYTDDGRLMGHIVQVLAMLTPILERSRLDEGLKQHLIHLILSHHGVPEYGTVQKPRTAEALALHHADNMDAKMAMCRELDAKLGEGENDWTEYHHGLEGSFFRPMRTPQEPQKVQDVPWTAAEPAAPCGAVEAPAPAVDAAPAIAPTPAPETAPAPAPEIPSVNTREAGPDTGPDSGPVTDPNTGSAPAQASPAEPHPAPKKRKKSEGDQCLSLLKV